MHVSFNLKLVKACQNNVQIRQNKFVVIKNCLEYVWADQVQGFLKLSKMIKTAWDTFESIKTGQKTLNQSKTFKKVQIGPEKFKSIKETFKSVQRSSIRSKNVQIGPEKFKPVQKSPNRSREVQIGPKNVQIGPKFAKNNQKHSKSGPKNTKIPLKSIKSRSTLRSCCEFSFHFIVSMPFRTKKNTNFIVTSLYRFLSHTFKVNIKFLFYILYRLKLYSRKEFYYLCINFISGRKWKPKTYWTHILLCMQRDIQILTRSTTTTLQEIQDKQILSIDNANKNKLYVLDVIE